MRDKAYLTKIKFSNETEEDLLMNVENNRRNPHLRLISVVIMYLRGLVKKL